MTMTAEGAEAGVTAARGDGFLAVSMTAPVGCVGVAMVCDMGHRPDSESGYGRGRNEPLNRPRKVVSAAACNRTSLEGKTHGRNLPEGWLRTRISFATS